MNIEGRQDTDRLAYVYNYIGPALEPVNRLLKHLADSGRTRPVSLGTFTFLLAHGAAAPFTLVPLARHFDDADPMAPAEIEAHADLAADCSSAPWKTTSAPTRRAPRQTAAPRKTAARKKK